MNFNAIFKNVKIIKIGLLDAKLQKILRRPGESEGGEEGDRNEKLFLEPPRESIPAFKKGSSYRLLFQLYGLFLFLIL